MQMKFKLSDLSKTKYDKIVEWIKKEFGNNENTDFYIVLENNNGIITSSIEKENNIIVNNNIIKAAVTYNKKIILTKREKDKILREDLKTFLKSHIIYNKDCIIKTKVLYKSYINWCIKNNKKYIYISESSFKTDRFDKALKEINEDIWRANDCIYNALYCTIY